MSRALTIEILFLARDVYDNKNIADNIREITDSLNHYNSPEEFSLLLQGLSAKDIKTGETGLTWLIQAKLDKQLFFQLFEKIGAVKFASIQHKDMMTVMYAYKTELRSELQEYINTITDLDILKRITDPTTLLGQFIDYQTSFIPSKNSNTRTLVNARIKVLLTVVATSSSTATKATKRHGDESDCLEEELKVVPHN